MGAKGRPVGLGQIWAEIGLKHWAQNGLKFGLKMGYNLGSKWALIGFGIGL